MSGIKKLRKWFFEITSSKLRFRNGDKPNQTTFENLLASLLFKSENDDRAKLDDSTNEIQEKVGHVVLATDAQAKSNEAQKNDRSLVVQPSQLPTVIPKDSSVEVEIDSTVGTRNVYKIKANGGILADTTDTVSKNNLFDKIQVGEGISLEIVEIASSPKENALKLDLVPPADSPLFYIDSNNTSSDQGNGSILNPFVSLERFVQRLDGDLDLGNKITTRVTAVVRAGNYTVTTNLWRGVNYNFEKGSVITCSENYLFDNANGSIDDGGEIIGSSGAYLNGRHSYPNIFGEGDFRVKGFFNLSPQDLNSLLSESINATISFLYLENTSTLTGPIINLGWTGYQGNSQKSIVYRIVGNNNGQKAIFRRNDDVEMIESDTSNTATNSLKTAAFQCLNVEFINSYSSNLNDREPIKLINPTFGVRFENCTFRSNSSSGEHPSSFIDLDGEEFRSLTLVNCDFFHGNTTGFTCISSGCSGTVSSFYFILNNVTYSNSYVGFIDSNRFIDQTGNSVIKANFTTIVSFGGVYSGSNEITGSTSPKIDAFLNFESGGVATLKGLNYASPIIDPFS